MERLGQFRDGAAYHSGQSAFSQPPSPKAFNAKTLAFLISGPATTVPAMIAVWSLVRPRVFALYLGIAVIGAMLLGLVAGAIL